MATLLLAEHDGATIKDATAKALTAAKALGGDVDVLVAGSGCKAAADAAAPAKPTMLGAVLLCVLLIVALAVGWKYWREAHEEEATDSPDDLLASFEEAYAAGEIDEQEIKRLRAKLSGTSTSSSSLMKEAMKEALRNKVDREGKSGP